MNISEHIFEILTITIRLIYCSIFLFTLLGWSLLSGMFLFIIGAGINIFLSKSFSKLV
jgi:hypothetical protein